MSYALFTARRRIFRHMPRRLALCAALSFSGLAPVGCGTQPVRPRIAQGEGEWLIRRNPAACLLDQPSLYFEIRLGERWSRVRVEGPDAGTEQMAEQLNQLFAEDALAIRIVRGQLSRTFQSFMGAHPAQTLRLEALFDGEGQPLDWSAEAAD